MVNALSNSESSIGWIYKQMMQNSLLVSATRAGLIRSGSDAGIG